MAQGQRLSDWQIETIRLAFAETGSISHAAREAGCHRSTARSYVLGDDDLQQLRQQKKGEVVELVARARRLYLEHLCEPRVIDQTESADAAKVVGILTDKHQLLTGEATTRTENRPLDSGIRTRCFSRMPSRRRQAARYRAPMAS